MQYIPTVNEEVLASCYQSTIEQGYNEKLIPNLLKDNPSVFNMIQDVVKSGDFNDDFIEGFCKGITCCYGLINSQMECNFMNENIKI